MQKYKAKKYIRLSFSEDKENESNSVTNQRKMLDSFIAANADIEDCGEKVDDGCTGIIFDRPAFKELMEEIHAGEINCVIVKDLSRLGREYIETGRYLRRIFPSYGVRFIAINDNIDTAKGTAGDDIMVTFQSIVNDAYSRDISTKTRSALNVKRENGDYVGACPVYGYRKDDENKNQLVIDEYAAAYVRDIYRMKIGGLSAAGIAKELNQRGVLSPLEYKKSRGLPYPKGGFADRPDAKWSPNTIIRILSDETYTGTLVQGKRGALNYKVREIMDKPASEWARYEGTHEAVISHMDYDIVQRLAQLDTRSASNGRPVHLFSGLLVCGSCGNKMTRKTVPYKGKSYYYYFCPTGKKNGCTGSTMVKENDLVDCVLGSIRGHIASVVSLDTLVSAMQSKRTVSELARQYKAQIAENEKQIAEKKLYKAGLNQHLVMGNLSKSEYKAIKSDISADIQHIQDAIQKLRWDLENLISGGSERQKWIARFKEMSNLAELDRRTVVYLIHSIKVKGKDDVQIAFNYRPEYENVLAKLNGEVA